MNKMEIHQRRQQAEIMNLNDKIRKLEAEAKGTKATQKRQIQQGAASRQHRPGKGGKALMEGSIDKPQLDRIEALLREHIRGGPPRRAAPPPTTTMPR